MIGPFCVEPALYTRWLPSILPRPKKYMTAKTLMDEYVFQAFSWISPATPHRWMNDKITHGLQFVWEYKCSSNMVTAQGPDVEAQLC